MSYIENNLLTNETILFRTKKHPIIFFLPAAWAVFAICATSYMSSEVLLNKLVWLPGVLTVFLWAYSGLQYAFSDYVVTDKRVMMREGFFIRRTSEMRINTISQVNADQSLLGQLLNYGMVSLHAFGAIEQYTMINQPGNFQRYVNQQLNK